MLAKIILSRLGLPYSTWQRLNLFRHGLMDDPAYAIAVLRSHLDEAIKRGVHESEFVVLELGPGDSLATGLIAKAFGARKSYLVDMGFFARKDLGLYARVLDQLNSFGMHSGELNVASFQELLIEWNITYLTQGLESLKAIPTGSIDLVFSQAVLEHIRFQQFDDIQRELHRVLGERGIASHVVDLKDHLGGSLNNLRFSRDLWERDWMAKSGFYTNRIRCSDMLHRFQSIGFQLSQVRIDRWDSLPIDRSKLNSEFSLMSDEELRVQGIQVVLTKSHRALHDNARESTSLAGF